MTGEQKLASIVYSLRLAGIDVLVMGGHAVRHYGIDRNTNDFDLVTSLATTDELRARLPGVAALGPVREGPVWRGGDFARFEVGRLPDGREEWLEFWLRNHLLADFASLKARAEVGIYGGEELAFLAIPDLMRSKETERESDWQDITLLEEVQDARLLAAVSTATGTPADPPRDAVVRLLSRVRSRRGMDRVIERRLADDREVAAEAMAGALYPATYAFLLPKAPAGTSAARPVEVEPAALAALSAVDFGSPKHFALVEICRRWYKRRAMEADRADKQAALGRAVRRDH